jgi:hypothetical protein
MMAGATSGDRFRSWPEILANAARAAGGLRALGIARMTAWPDAKPHGQHSVVIC